MIGDAYSSLADDIRLADALARETWPGDTVLIAPKPCVGSRKFLWIATGDGGGELCSSGEHLHLATGLGEVIDAMRDILRARDADSAEDDEADRAYEKWKATRDDAAE